MVAMLYGAQKGQDRVLRALIWAHDMPLGVKKPKIIKWLEPTAIAIHGEDRHVK